jgi:twitching motility protein PilJ
MSTNTRSLGSRISNFGTRLWATILIIALLIFAVNFGWTTYLVGKENTARARAAELQVKSQQLAKFSQQAVQGNAEAFDEFAKTKSDIDLIVKA